MVPGRAPVRGKGHRPEFGGSKAPKAEAVRGPQRRVPNGRNPPHGRKGPTGAVKTAGTGVAPGKVGFRGGKRWPVPGVPRNAKTRGVSAQGKPHHTVPKTPVAGPGNKKNR